ncbi:MAG: class I SAM-dependent methyltransferase [Betaproteobacteria bacterium]
MINKELAAEACVIRWLEGEVDCSARWRSAAGVLPPKRVQVVDDTLTADAAFRLACEGTALLWRGDFQNARQLLQAMARRFDSAQRKPRKANLKVHAPSEAFHLYRMAQAQRARMLGMLLIPFVEDHVIPLRRAPEVRLACEEVYGLTQTSYVTSLRELLGLVGAHEWRKKGVEIPALGERIHAHYGVFSPVRGEYVALVAEAPLPQALQKNSRAYDIGTGTGVLAAVLAKRGVQSIVATDQSEQALACARENASRLGLSRQVEVLKADLFPPGNAALIVCNPPWLPGKPGSPLEHAIYDQDSSMLKGFLDGLAAHLFPGGEGWLILSDLAEHLDLRSRVELLSLFGKAGLKVLGRQDVRPTHPRASDVSDPLYAARAAEVTSLWRLGEKD